MTKKEEAHIVRSDFTDLVLPNPIIELGIITFKEPLVLEWVWVENGVVYFQWPFGMNDSCPLNEDHIPLWMKDCKTWQEKLIRYCEFHIGHAFFHYNEDPNYTEYHWALYGNLKDLILELDDQDPELYYQ